MLWFSKFGYNPSRYLQLDRFPEMDHDVYLQFSHRRDLIMYDCKSILVDLPQVHLFIRLVTGIHGFLSARGTATLLGAAVHGEPDGDREVAHQCT